MRWCAPDYPVGSVISVEAARMPFRSLLLFLVLLLAPSLTWSAPLDGRVEQIISEGGARRAVWGVYAIDSRNGNVLADVGGTRLQVPASNRKLVATAIAVSRFNRDTVFTTELRADGLSAGVISGDLVLYAAGDPSWTPELIGGRSGHTKLNELARLAAKNGLKHVKGDLVIDTGCYETAEPIPPGWAWDNLGDTYAARPSAISMNENLVGITIKPSRAGQPLDVSFPIGAEPFEIINQSRTLGGGSAPSLRIDRRIDGGALTILGGLPQGAGDSNLTIPAGRPVSTAAVLLKAALEKEGVTIDGAIRYERNTPRGASQLAAVNGAPLADIIRVCNRESDNFLAESIYLLCAANRFGSASYRGGYKLEEEFWKSIKVDQSEINPADGSGLSRENFITPHALVMLLKSREDVDWFVDSLPVSGQSGTLRYRLSQDGLAGRVKAKTGTLDSTSALSGYVRTASGRSIIFSIMANNYTCSTNTIRGAIDDIVTVLSRQ